MKVENREQNISKEDFRELCLTVAPMIETVRKFLKERGIDKMASLVMTADGYVNFDVFDTDWSMTRMSADEDAQIRNRYIEVLKL